MASANGFGRCGKVENCTKPIRQVVAVRGAAPKLPPMLLGNAQAKCSHSTSGNVRFEIGRKSRTSAIYVECLHIWPVNGPLIGLLISERTAEESSREMDPEQIKNIRDRKEGCRLS